MCYNIDSKSVKEREVIYMNNITNDTMRGLFFIIKGRHNRNLSPSYVNKVTGETGNLGGYDPYSDTTEEWYQVLDRKSYHSIYCGNDYERAVTAVRRMIVRYKGVAKNYFREVSRLTSDDYYEVHYLGHRELTPEQRAKKQEGRCPRTSPIMMDMYRNIDMLWGDVFAKEVEEQEDLAYNDLIEERPVNKSRKIVQRAKKSLGLTPVKEETPKEVSRPTLKKVDKKKDVTSTIIKPAKRNVKLLRV